MNKKLKKKWVQALRSGKYEQARSFLVVNRTGDFKPQFCCLGVLCDINNMTSVHKNGFTKVLRSNSEGGVLSSKGLVQVGLTNKEQGTLANMNDTGSTFGEIATYIEDRKAI